VSLFAAQGTSQTDFNQWYCSNDNRQLAHWQQRIASSVVILQANQLVDDWLMQAEQLVTSLPLALQSVTAGLVESVKKTTLEKSQCRIA
jgi:octaprenyl-diphosphate synthase